jgi:hypothetical protein
MMRIAKYPHLPSFGIDMHQAMTPPLPVPLPPVPTAPFAVVIAQQASPLIFGKFTFRCVTEFLADTLMGHDWGMMQTHLCMLGPYAASPSNLTTTLGSSHKYFLPSYAVQETPTGGLIAMAGASGTAVAVTTPGFVIPLQDCQDSAGIGFALPTGVGMQLPSTRWVGFGWADLAAGLISMATDSACAAIGSGIGQAVGAVAKSVASSASGVVARAATALASDAGGMVFGAVLNIANNVVQTNRNAHSQNAGSTAGSLADTILFLPAAVGLLGGKAADAVGGLGNNSATTTTDANGTTIDSSRTGDGSTIGAAEANSPWYMQGMIPAGT